MIVLQNEDRICNVMLMCDVTEKELSSEKKEEESATAAIQKKLDETGEMLSDLQKTQHQRLSQKLPPHLAMLPGPSEKETKLGG